MQPFRTILFAADLSANSKEAFHTACSLATEDKTRLFLLHVVESAWAPEDSIQDRQRRCGASHESLLQAIRDVYCPGRPVDVEYRAREGSAAEEILRMADEIGADLIVMGTQGPTPLRRLLAGSVAIAVLRGARCPVVALRSTANPTATHKLRVIIHPTDFSEESTDALRIARSLARDQGARLILLHVAPFYMIQEDGTTAELGVGSLRDSLEAAREIVDGPDLKYPVETWFSRGMAAEEIVRVAAEIEGDLIVMGTHGRTGLRRLLMGNTAESVLPEASCPVMIVKASEPSLSPSLAMPKTTDAAIVI